MLPSRYMGMLRLTVTTEFPLAAVAVLAHRITLRSRLSQAIEGNGVVCVDSRYASVQWRGAPRLTRLNAPAATWRVLNIALPSIQPGNAASAELAQLLGEGRGVDVVCASVHPITAAPFDMVAVLDALSCVATE